MLQEAGGLITDKVEKIELGGKVLVRGEWVVILKINRKDEKICSLLTNRRYVSQVGIEAEKVKKAMSLPPMCNYPGEGFCKMTKANYASVYTDSKGGRVVKATETTAQHRVRSVMNHIARRINPECKGAREQWGMVNVYITDEKRKDPPPPELIKEEPVKIDPPERVVFTATYKEPEPTAFDAMKDTLKAGIKVVSAPQLFPTPPDIAARMVELAEIEPGQRILEPSAGTGNILSAILAEYSCGYEMHGGCNKPNKEGLDVKDCAHCETGTLQAKRARCEIVAVEINLSLTDALRDRFREGIAFQRADFLSVNGNLGTFDRIIMNPPFDHGSDIKHIKHAESMLAPGGRLVALCANGSRQQEEFRDRADLWEDLPEGSFSAEGTGVNVALMIIERKKLFNEGLF
jgi:SAM-dependent methyltransferase